MRPQRIHISKFSPESIFINRPLTLGRAELIRRTYRPHISFSVFEMMMKMMMVGLHLNSLLKID